MSVQQAGISAEKICMNLNYLSLQKMFCSEIKPLSERPEKYLKISSTDLKTKDMDLCNYFVMRFDEIFLMHLNCGFPDDYIKDTETIKKNHHLYNFKWHRQNVLTTYYSHSAFQTLIKTQVKNGNRPNKILGSYNACQWIRENTKDFDGITQREVIKTGLIGRSGQFGSTDIFENNQLSDGVVYLFSDPEKCGKVTFYTDDPKYYVHTIYSTSSVNNDSIKNQNYVDIIDDLNKRKLISDETKEEIFKSLDINNVEVTTHINKDFEIYFDIDFDINGISRIEII